MSRRMFEEILKDEEDHADEIADLLYTVDPKTGKDRRAVHRRR